jgi:hypothetical protein
MKLRRAFENFLLLGGLIALNVWVWTLAATAIYQSWQGWTFDREANGLSTGVAEFLSAKSSAVAGELLGWWGFPRDPSAPETGKVRQSPPEERLLIPPNGLVGRLVVPRLRLTAMVRQGADEDT